MHTEAVRLVAQHAVHEARTIARHEFERVHKAVTGRLLPRADGDIWWPGTSPLVFEAQPAPAPLSRRVDLAHREGRR